MHPAKRRRMDDVASTRIKPFRSPLRANPHKPKSSPEQQNKPLSQGSDDQKGTPNATQPAPSSPVDKRATPSTWVHSRQAQVFPLRPFIIGSPKRDEEYIALQKQHSALALRFKHLSSSLDVGEQAVRIAQSSKENELQRLITKWRTASQDAAEDLFTTAKDQVTCMGGVSIWRKKYMRTGGHGFREEEPEIDENDLNEDQREQLEFAREEARLEAERYGLSQDEPNLNVEDDDSFTMGMMLKQLNIDLDLIGFDAQAQEWMH